VIEVLYFLDSILQVLQQSVPVLSSNEWNMNFVNCSHRRYFEDDDDDQKNLSELEYQPAPGSPTLDRMNAAAANEKQDDSSSDSSDDPLESFMADIEV